MSEESKQQDATEHADAEQPASPDPDSGAAEPTASQEGEGTERASAGKRRFSLVGIAKTLGVLVLLLVVILVGFGIYWSREPAAFDVEEEARRYAQLRGHVAEGDPIPPGYVSVHALHRVMDTLLSKPGGWLSNDRMPPGTLVDNIPNWEYGALAQARDFVSVLRQDFSRSRAQSEEWPELSEAEARFNYEHGAWILPSAESEFRAGLEFLDQYMGALAGTAEKRATYTIRADALSEWLRRVERRLGGLAIGLRASAGSYQYDPNVLTSGTDTTNQVSSARGKTPRGKVDNVFFEARGAAWALYHLLKASRHDFRDVIDGQRAMGSVNRALSELHAAIQPFRAPIVMNGEDFSVTPNHSMTLAAYLAKAHLSIADLRALMAMGGSGGGGS